MKAPLLLSGTIVTVVACHFGAGPVCAAGTGAQEALRAHWPRYDPPFRRHHLETRARETDLVTVTPAPSAIAAVRPEPAPTEKAEASITLPTVTIRALAPPKTPARLPRLVAPSPERDLKGDDFESPSAASDRLIQKHLTRFDQALNKFTLPLVGQSLAARAAAAEAEEKKTAQINQIADAIEIGEKVTGDPELTKRLRKEFLRMYYSTPK